MIRRVRALILFLLAVSVAGPSCRETKPDLHPREYPLAGEVLSINPARTEITVKHGDVKGFMPAMTMPFAVKEPRQVEGLTVGDLVTATLVVNDEESYLKGIEKTGSLPPEQRTHPQPAAVEGLAPGALIPDVALTDEAGHPLTLAAYRGRFVLFTFIYTRCPLPDYCPRMNRFFADIQKAMAAKPALKDALRLLSISFDPDRDTPSVLRSHAKQMGADPAVWHFATAPGRKVDAFGASLGLSVTREGQADGTISHNLRTALMDRNGVLVKIYTGNDWSPDAVVRDVEALIK